MLMFDVVNPGHETPAPRPPLSPLSTLPQIMSSISTDDKAAENNDALAKPAPMPAAVYIASVKQPFALPSSQTGNATLRGQIADGLLIELLPDASTWAPGDTPVLQISEQNIGTTDVPATKAMEHGAVEVDGVWYHWPGMVSAFIPRLKSGEVFSNIPLRLTSDWKNSTSNLHLTAGKHTIRFAFAPFSERAISNPVEIIIADEKK
jgi:hypothetical protein